MKLRVCLVLLVVGGLQAVTQPVMPAGAADWERLGRLRFAECEFKQAARAFENALAQGPEKAGLHFWLGKSYARLAEISSPLAAPKQARRALRSLQRAVQLEPHNQEYALELFEFWLDSPEWRPGRLAQAAALLERIGPLDPGAEACLRNQVEQSRREHSGPGWWLRLTVLRPAGDIGRILP